MEKLRLQDRIVLEVFGKKECTPAYVAELLRQIADQIEFDGRNGGSYDDEYIGEPDKSEPYDILWERECTAYGFRMGDKSLIGMHYYGSEKKDEFPVITLMREDLEQKGFDTSNLGDEWMEKIASKVGDILLDSDYWDHLVWAAEYYKVPRKEE